MPERTGTAVCREHGVLQRVFGILGGAGGEPGKPVQVTPVAMEQLAERVAVAGDVGCQQLGVAALTLDVSPEPHGRTVSNRPSRGTSLRSADVSLSSELRIRSRPGP